MGKPPTSSIFNRVFHYKPSIWGGFPPIFGLAPSCGDWHPGRGVIPEVVGKLDPQHVDFFLPTGEISSNVPGVFMDLYIYISLNIYIYIYSINHGYIDIHNYIYIYTYTSLMAKNISLHKTTLALRQKPTLLNFLVIQAAPKLRFIGPVCCESQDAPEATHSCFVFLLELFLLDRNLSTSDGFQ